MPHLLSGHLRNAGILAVAATVALLTERLAAVPPSIGATPPRANGIAEVGRFVTPVGLEMLPLASRLTIGVDPFGGGFTRQPLVGSGTIDPTVTQTAAPKRLTAILVADDRRVAVIDDDAVGVGDALRDGAKVSSIQADRVWLVHRNGQWQMLSLRPQGQ